LACRRCGDEQERSRYKRSRQNQTMHVFSPIFGKTPRSLIPQLRRGSGGAADRPGLPLVAPAISG
jgi:hypothetical protein